MDIFEQRESAIRAYSRVYPTVFKTAQNARQTDSNGKEYIDFFAGAGVLNFGHNNEKMKQALIDYLNANGVLHSLDMKTEAKSAFIQQFEEVILKPRNMPHRLQFTGPTGTNAVEAAMKLARRVTGRKHIVAFHHGFHGMTLGSLAATANPYFRGAAGVPLEHVSHQPFGDVSTDGEALIAELREQILSSDAEKPAAFLLETIQAEGGVNVADPNWIQGVSKLAKDVGALLIVDEIQVGCGRTGSYFSFDDLNIDPDIICLAKGIGGIGTPMAMNLVKPELDDHWSPGEHTGTFRGQNLSFVAGKVALDYFNDATLMDEVNNKAKYVRSQMQSLLSYDPSLQLRGKGLILGLDVVSSERGAAIVRHCFEQGLIIASCGIGGKVIKLIPPLTIPQADLTAGLDILMNATRLSLEEAA